jgi:hypothetical protein
VRWDFPLRDEWDVGVMACRNRKHLNGIDKSSGDHHTKFFEKSHARPAASKNGAASPSHVTVVGVELKIQVECPAREFNRNGISDVDINASDLVGSGRGIHESVEGIHAGVVSLRLHLDIPDFYGETKVLSLLVNVVPDGVTGSEVRGREMSFLPRGILKFVALEVNRHDLQGAEPKRSHEETRRQRLQGADNKLAVASGELRDKYS